MSEEYRQDGSRSFTVCPPKTYLFDIFNDPRYHRLLPGSSGKVDRLPSGSAAGDKVLGETMRIAVFSDIHANREALEAFCEHAANRRIDRYMCLGDVVGYGADPEWCISRLHALPAVDCILGNHDHAVAGAPYSMGRAAQKVIEWTRKQLSGRVSGS